jgi:uncharacterized membrane protein YqiK
MLQSDCTQNASHFPQGEKFMTRNGEIEFPAKKGNALVSLAVLAVVAVLIVSWSTVTYIPPDKVGVVTRKLGGGSLPPGRLIATKGENGVQAAILSPGYHFFYMWPFYSVDTSPVVDIPAGSIATLTARDGKALPSGEVYAPEWSDHDRMIDAQFFLTEGSGFRGPQLSVLPPGSYRLNPALFTTELTPVTDVKVGNVGVVKSNVGAPPTVDLTGAVVPKGQRGIWDNPLEPQQYYLHPRAYEVTLINIRKQVVDYTASNQEAKVDMEARGPIVVRSSDGFTFPVDVRVVYNIEQQNAPRVVATVGDDERIMTVLTPAIRDIFRNRAESVKALDYVSQRSRQGEEVTRLLAARMEEFGVTVEAVLIGNVGDEQSLGQLLKTQTDREIARQELETFVQQQRAAEQEKQLNRAKQAAEEERKLVMAEVSVKSAEQDALKVAALARGEAERIREVAKAQADAYKLVAEALGSENAALIEIMKAVKEGNIRIAPDVLVSGGGGGLEVFSALGATMLRDAVQKAPAE